MWRSVAEKIIFEVQWRDKKASNRLQFQQRKSSLKISKILNGKGILALLQTPGVTVKLLLQKFF